MLFRIKTYIGTYLEPKQTFHSEYPIRIPNQNTNSEYPLRIPTQNTHTESKLRIPKQNLNSESHTEWCTKSHLTDSQELKIGFYICAFIFRIF